MPAIPQTTSLSDTAATDSAEPDVAGTGSDTEGEPILVALVRYGAMPQVGRFAVEDQIRETVESQSQRVQVVASTERGMEMGQLLSILPEPATDRDSLTGDIVRVATLEDEAEALALRTRCEQEFNSWLERIDEWGVEVQLVDLEFTLEDHQIVLYVLNDQDAENTRLALLAAAAGHGIIHVQPVSAEGVQSIGKPGSGGGCGSGGCGSGGCGG